MTRRWQLTDTKLASLKADPAGKLQYLPDSEVPNLFVRVGANGRKSFVLYTRYPGSPAPSRRSLGRYGALTLAKAREKARGWVELIERGIDPKHEEEKQRAAEQRRRKNTFAAVAEDFIADKLAKERKGAEVARDIRRDLTPHLGPLPVTDISDDQLASLVKMKARTAPAQARNMLGTVKRLFQWAIDQRAYGLKSSPATQLKPAALCGEKISRRRVLSDEGGEVAAFWCAVGRLKSPYREIYRLLLLTGLRLNEVVDAAWPEFHLAVVRALRQSNGAKIDWSKLSVAELTWTIPATRMKAKESRARPHVVPLTSEMLELIESLPRFERGNYLFSTTYGQKPVWISNKIKQKVDVEMLSALRSIAEDRGDILPTELEPWTNHDIRRTVRSQLSRLKISEEAREAVLAHARPGLKDTYDQYHYLDEKREALELWAARLRTIVEPAPSNVVALRA